PVKRVIRGPKVKARLPPMIEKDRCCDRLRPQQSRHHHPLDPNQHKAHNALEEPERLRGQAMPAPREAMQCVKAPHRLEAMAELDPEIRSLSLLDTPSHRSFQPFEKQLWPLTQPDIVPVKC